MNLLQLTVVAYKELSEVSREGEDCGAEMIRRRPRAPSGGVPGLARRPSLSPFISLCSSLAVLPATRTGLQEESSSVKRET